jgi:hypothetical protein
MKTLFEQQIPKGNFLDSFRQIHKLAKDNQGIEWDEEKQGVRLIPWPRPHTLGQYIKQYKIFNALVRNVIEFQRMKEKNNMYN